MVVFVNGSFGVGKTTVTRLVSARLAGAAIFDPELLGFVLQRARRLAGRPVDDFQDLALWRRLVVAGVRLLRTVRRTVIVPMAFSNAAYLDEVRSGIARFEPEVLHFCLVAPLAVVNERLAHRGARAATADLAWQYRRAAECCAVHDDPAFAEQLPTAGFTPDAVADQLLARIIAARRR